jgi:hypothetical protein
MYRLLLPLPDYTSVTLHLDRDHYRRREYLLLSSERESSLEMYLMELEIAIHETRRNLRRPPKP